MENGLHLHQDHLFWIMGMYYCFPLWVWDMEEG